MKSAPRNLNLIVQKMCASVWVKPRTAHQTVQEPMARYGAGAETRQNAVQLAVALQGP